MKKQPKQTWLSQWLTDKLPFDFEPLIDAGNTLAEWLPPFQSPADHWWLSEYYWGAMIWFFFLSYESEQLFAVLGDQRAVANTYSQLVYVPSHGTRPYC